MRKSIHKINAILGITGMPGSRKSDVAQIISQRHFPVYNMGDIIREEIVQRGLEPTPENYYTTGIVLRKDSGEEVLARRIILQCSGEQEVAVIDGIRTKEEVTCFTQHCNIFRLLCVYAPRSMRFNRMRQRSGKDLQNEEDLIRQDDQNLSLGIGEVISLADYMVVNDGILTVAIESQVDNYISQFIREIAIYTKSQTGAMGNDSKKDTTNVASGVCDS